MNGTRRQKAAKIRHLLETERDAILTNTTHFNQERYDAIANLEEYDQLRDKARTIKEDAIDSLPELIDQLRESVTENGGQVYLADDAADANQYIEEIVVDEGCESVVKSKSMTTEELDLNEHLEDQDVDVWETDLGEFVLQVADEAPSHLVGPSFHKSRGEIAHLFNSHFKPKEPLETAEELTKFARNFLGERIREADIGMTGANFVAASSGTMMLVTNEGNARKSAVVPDTHIAVAGVEKLLPTVNEFEPFIQLIARAATGQDIAQYISLLSPPVDTPTINFDAPDAPGFGGGNGERDFHLVLVDNGRFNMREDDQLRETLYCIRCGACANSCANFQHVGGHAFGGETYSGGIATGWETGIHGQDSAAEFNELCTGTLRCVPNCPVKIDIPWINTVVRDRVNRDTDSSKFDWLVEGLAPDEEPAGVDIQKRFFSNFETVAKLGSATAPISNWMADTWPVRLLMDRALGIDRRRSLPEFRHETLQTWFDNRGGSRISAAAADREVVLYPDLYTDHVHVERGKAAIRTLEALGVAVRIPDIPDSGRPALSQGMVATAERNARRAYSALTDHLDAGRDVVVIEPSDLVMFRREYEKLLPVEAHRRLADNSYEVLEYVYGLMENGADADALADPHGLKLAYHSHCQQRTLNLDAYTEAVLEHKEYDIVNSNVECCGMAGSFGYKTEYYELSIDVGEPLKHQFEPESDRAIIASGTSCLDQLEYLLSRPTYHPVQVIDPARID